MSFESASDRNLDNALQESEESFCLIVDAVKDYAIFRLDPNGYIISWNSGAERIKGYKAAEIIGQHFSCFYPVADIRAAKPQENLDIAAAIGSAELEGWRVRKDGSLFWASIVITALRDRSGTLYGFLKITRDLTERKQAQQVLQRYAERLKSLQDIDRAILGAQSLKAIVHAALSGISRLVQLQQSFVVLFDFDNAQAHVIEETLTADWAFLAHATFPISDFIPPELLPLQPEDAADFFLAYPPLFQQRGVQPVASYISLPLVTNHSLIGQIVLGSDCRAAFDTEDLQIFSEVANQIAIAIQQAQLREQLQRKASELEQRVADRTAELQSANAELEAFAYSVSHDLRAPLRAMQGFSQALLEDYGDRMDALAQEYAHRITSAAERMDTLIQELLSYSRLARSDIKLQPISLLSAIDFVLAELEEAFNRVQAHVTVERASLQVQVLGNRTALIQVLTNLLSNAVKFTQSGVPPHVRLWVQEESTDAVAENDLEYQTQNPKWVRLWIEDNGIGIDPQYHDRIFHVFERLHGVESYPGTGIGLAIVRKGVERMEGRVGVESQAERGSRFWIELQKVEGSP